jgi:hypothetical protein
MPADFFIDTPLGMVFSKATEVLDWAEALDHMDRLQAHPDFRPEFNQLIDFRPASPITLTHEQVRRLAHRPVFSARSRRAFVVASDLAFGLGRAFSTYRDLAGEPGIVIFREMPPALAWLGLAAEPDPGLFPKLNPPLTPASPLVSGQV